MTVVVTGPSGHVGSNLVRALLAAGRKVRAVVYENAAPLEGMDVERVRADVRDFASVRRAMEGAEIVFHLAAVISISGDRGGLVPAVNVGGVANVARAAREAGVRRMVHCSSIHAFRITHGVPVHGTVDESTPRSEHPDDPAYDRSKWRGEQALRREIDRGLDAVIVNPTGIIGPLDHEPSRMGRVILDLARRKLPATVAGGFHWVDVRDVAVGLMAAETRGRTGENYILTGHWRSARQIAEITERFTGSRAPRFDTPLWLAGMAAPVATAIGRVGGFEPLFTTESLAALRATKNVSNAKAVRELGFAPRPIDETVRDTLAWFESAGKIPGGTVRV